MITIDFAIGVSISGIFGFFAGRYFDHFLAKRRNQESTKTAEFNKAATKFRDTFRPVLKVLIPPYEPLQEDFGAFLWRHFHDFKGAVVEFTPFLTDSKAKTAFLQAWYEYYCRDDARNENAQPYFKQYSFEKHTEEERQNIRRLARSRIEKILEFANPK